MSNIFPGRRHGAIAITLFARSTRISPTTDFCWNSWLGDELADYEHAPEITQEIEDDLVATGFLRMAPDPTWANLTGFVPDRLEVMADALDVLGSGVMGLTFKCARCHTHKFDPIPQRDYYRLIAIFKGAYDEHDWLKPELNAYGGAVSAGLGRTLPALRHHGGTKSLAGSTTPEIQRELEQLKAAPANPETAKQIKELEATRPPEPRSWLSGIAANPPRPTFTGAATISLPDLRSNRACPPRSTLQTGRLSPSRHGPAPNRRGGVWLSHAG